jgi:hypothetical protein
MLQESTTLTQPLPTVRLSSETERRLLDQARERARLKLLLVGGAVAIVVLAVLGSLSGLMLLLVRGALF